MSRVLITGARAPVALHLARLFTVAGHEAWLADTQAHPLARATRFAAGYVRLPRPRADFAGFGAAVERAVATHGIDLVIPTCEEVFFLAAARDVARRAIPLFAPDFAALADAHHKGRFAAGALGLGADPPSSQVVETAEALRGLDLSDKVLKPAWSRFASRVLVRPAAVHVVPTADDPWVVQDFLPGAEICGYGVARDGVLLGFAAYRPLHRAGLGAGVAFEPVEAPAAQSFAEGYARRTRWTGQLSFDYRHDAAGGLHAIECNPRATSGLHFFEPGDGLVEAMLGGAPAVATDLRAMTVPLALLAYGLPAAVQRGDVVGWWLDWRRVGNVLAFPGDRWLGPAQVAALAEIAGMALRRGVSLQQAATEDIEWNGEVLEARPRPSTGSG